MKAFNPLVSIIIPVYNVAEHLDQAVLSLLKQTHDSIEIILVDDCSTDDSWAICQKYDKKYENVVSLRNQMNSGGPLRSRARGIEVAHGEWITFMDCDDYVKPEYIEHLLKATENGKYDIAVTGHARLYPDGRVEDFLWGNYSQSTEQRKKAFYKHFKEGNFWTDPTDTVGQSLIRASVAKQTDLSIYPNKIACEDSLLALAFLQQSKNGVNFVDHHDFYWRQREGSGSHGGFALTASLPDFYRASYDIFNKNNLLPTVSVVVPAYNVEQYLKYCMQSISRQTYPALEVVIVDDESPDNSAVIADDYIKLDPRFKVIHKKKNEGLNMARATGFSDTTGEYVMFVDSDDLLTEDSVGTALRAMQKNGTDFVRFSRAIFKDQEHVGLNPDSLPEHVEVILRDKKDLYMTQFDQKKVLGNLSTVNMTVWGALYKRKHVEKVNWAEANYRIYEDNIWTLRFLENVSSCTYLSYVGYLYRSDDSIQNVLSKKLTGNSLNGKPIGYLEFWKNTWNEYLHYNKKYSVGAEHELQDLIRYLYIVRGDYITDAGLWSAETNLNYLSEYIKMYKETLDIVNRENNDKDTKISEAEKRNSLIINELIVKQSELDSHLSINRSIRLTLGNIKRRLKRTHFFRLGDN